MLLDVGESDRGILFEPHQCVVGKTDGGAAFAAGFQAIALTKGFSPFRRAPVCSGRMPSLHKTLYRFQCSYSGANVSHSREAPQQGKCDKRHTSFDPEAHVE